MHLLIKHARATEHIAFGLMLKWSSQNRKSDDQTPFTFTNQELNETKKNSKPRCVCALNRNGDEISKIMQLFIWSFILRTVMFMKWMKKKSDEIPYQSI